MLKEMVTDGSQGNHDKLVHLVVAAILAVPTCSSSAVTPDTVLEAWQERLLALSEHDQLAGVVEVIRGARYEAIGLLLDLLHRHEDDGDVEDFTLRRRWFRAVRGKIGAYTAGRMGAQSWHIDGKQPLRHIGGSARDQATAILQESMQLEFADTPLSTSLGSALVELEQARVGLFDAFALFFVSRIKDNIRFRQAVLAAEEPDQTILGVDAPSYLQTLFGIATTIAQRFDTQLNLLSEPPAVAIERGPAEPDRPAYWTGVAVAAAHARGLSAATLAAIGQYACSKSLEPAGAAGIIADMAGLLELVHIELTEHLDINDASRVSQALDLEGPPRALELLGSLSPTPATSDVPKQAVLERIASIERVKGRLSQLVFDYRRAIGHHMRAVELVVAGGEEARAHHVCALIEALIRQGRDLTEGGPLEQAASMCAALLKSPWLKAGSRLWIEVKRHQADALMEHARQQYNVGHVTRVDALYGEVVAALSPDDTRSMISTTRLRQGQAVMLLGTRSGNKSIRERALDLLRSATATADRNRDSYQFASAHVAFADALVATAEGEERKPRLNEAAKAYDKARLALSCAGAPFEWIGVHLKLGRISGTQAREARNGNDIYKAMSLLEIALQGIPTGLFKLQRAEILLEVGHLHSALATGSDWRAAQRRAILAYERALAQSDLRSDKPFLWMQSRQKWALAVSRIAKDEKNAELINKAIDGLLECIEIAGAEKHTLLFSNVQHDLGSVFHIRAELIFSNDDLAAAESAYLQAIEFRSPEKVPLQWTQSVIGLVSVLCVAVQHDPSRAPALRDAASQLEDALESKALQNTPHVNNIVSWLNEARTILAAL